MLLGGEDGRGRDIAGEYKRLLMFCCRAMPAGFWMTERGPARLLDVEAALSCGDVNVFFGVLGTLARGCRYSDAVSERLLVVTAKNRDV